MSIFPTTILLATDSSRQAELAATTAADLAERTNSELHLLTVGPDLPLYELADYPARFEDVLREQRRETKELLEEQVKRVQESGGTVNETYLREGRADEEIVVLAEEIGVGLIVMGSRGHGRLRRALMGSVSDSVVRHAHCPVLVVRADPIVFPAKILVATDGSKEAELASSSAADLAKRTGSELHVVHVRHIPLVFYESPGTWTLDPDLQSRMEERAEEETRAKLNEQVQRVREADGEVAEAHVRLGEPDAEIVRLAEELGVRLIVLGSRGLGPLRNALVGSVSHTVIRHAHCPVLVVRSEEEQAA